MRLDPQDLIVTSFDTEAESDALKLPTIDTNDPTPATACRWCPPGSTDCVA